MRLDIAIERHGVIDITLHHCQKGEANGTSSGPTRRIVLTPEDHAAMLGAVVEHRNEGLSYANVAKQVNRTSLLNKNVNGKIVAGLIRRNIANGTLIKSGKTLRFVESES